MCSARPAKYVMKLLLTILLLLSSQHSHCQFSFPQDFLSDFAEFIKKQRAAKPAGEDELNEKWQQSQYMCSMFSTQHSQLSNERYKNLIWTSGLTYVKSFIK